MVASELSAGDKKLRFFVSLANAAVGLDPDGRLESLAFLVGRFQHHAPRYDFHLKGGKPASWALLADLGVFRWRPEFPVDDPIDRIGALQVKPGGVLEDAAAENLRRLLVGLNAPKLDQLAGLVFVHDLLASTGRPAEDEAVVEKYWQLVPAKSRPRKDELPVDVAREVYALAA